MPRRADRPGDPLALVDLLWAPSTRVGRSGVTVESVVAGAVALADDGGLGAVTMRAVAERAGIPTMTMYGTIPGRPELVELMVDHVAGLTYAAHPLPEEAGDWRAALRQTARRVLDLTLEHPWTLDVPAGRPVLGPGVCLTYEQELRALDGLGLSDLEMDDTLTTVRSVAMQSARWQVGLDRVRSSSGLSDEQWWEQVGPRLERAMDELDLPIARRVGESVSSAGEPERMLDLALDLILRGVAERLRERAT